MRKKLLILTYCFMLSVAVAGCKGSGSAGGAGGFDIGDIYAGGGDIGGGDIGGGGGDIGGGGDLPINPNPEPATVLLLGGGLAGYAFLHNRKKKKK